MYIEVIYAIENKMVLEFQYFSDIRRVEPHCVGLGKDGQPLLRAFQISGQPRQWKLFRLDRARHVQPTNDNFSGPRPEYRRNDKAMVKIIKQL